MGEFCIHLIDGRGAKMWGFLSLPIILPVRYPCCQKQANFVRKQLFPLQHRYHASKPKPCYQRWGIITTTCQVETENVSDLAEKSHYEILEEKRLPGSKLCIHVQVNGSQTKRYFEKELSEHSKTAVVPGFRKGKAPRPVLINQLGPKIASKACTELIQATVREVLSQPRYTPLSRASLSEKEEDVIKTFQPGNPFSFWFTFDAYPQVQFKEDYRGLRLKAKREEFDPTMIENTLVELQQRNAELVPVSDETVVGRNHVVVVDIKAWYANPDGTKGESLSHLVAESEAEVDMERGVYMEGFKEGIEGARVGETVSVALQFPDNAKRQDLRGISAIFDISIKGLKRRELPPLDDALVKSHTQYSTLQELRDAITKQLELEIQKANDRHIEKALEDSLAEIVEMEIPEKIAEEHSQRKFANLLADMKDQGIDEETMKKSLSQETYQKYKQETWSATLKELKVWFALQEVARRERLEPSDEEIAREMDHWKEQQEEEMKDMDPNDLQERIKTDLEQSKTIEFLRNHATIEYISS